LTPHLSGGRKAEVGLVGPAVGGWVLGDIRDVVSLVTRTLFANGVLNLNTASVGNALLLTCERPDRFGCRVRYIFTVVDGDISAEALRQMEAYAESEHGQLVVIGDGTMPTGRPVRAFGVSAFLERFGGAVPTLLPLEASYAERLHQLGSMTLPSGITGEPESIFETYVGAGLQFALGTVAVQYGAKRSGEKVPDGLIALPRDKFILYDAKSSLKGYAADASEMRKFEDYVSDFSSRYKTLGQPFAFVIVSASFDMSDEVIAQRSTALYATARVPGVFMTTEALACAVTALKDAPELRNAVRWEDVFSKPQVTASVVTAAINAAKRDRIGTLDT
jgi:hypothetical protein